jgi:putative ABC transport system ATP-binding protein
MMVDAAAQNELRPRRPEEIVVRVEQVSREYVLGDQRVVALSNVSLNIEKGVFLALAGPSGSGKSTLLNMIGCIDTPTHGSIWINGRDVGGQTPDQLAALRARTIGFVFQTFNLFPVLTAEENVAYPLQHRTDVSVRDRRERVRHHLEIVGLADYAKHRPNQLSGGQRQRVAIARALVGHPEIVLADEPTANLDHRTGRSILKLMRKLNRETRVTFIFSTHDPQVIRLADRRVDLEDGQVVRLGVREGQDWRFAFERSPLVGD